MDMFTQLARSIFRGSRRNKYAKLPVKGQFHAYDATRQRARAHARAQAFADISARFGPEPRRIRRSIAMVIARREWRQYLPVVPVSAEP